MNRLSTNRKGMTLIEVLLALVVSSLLLLAGTALLVNFSRAWAERPADRQVFEAHVSGVTRFLSSSLAKSVPSVLNEQETAVRLDWPVGSMEPELPLITFSLKEAPPVLFWPQEATAGITCHLLFEENVGLSVLWFSNLQEMAEEKNEKGKVTLKEEDALFKTLVSPLVTKVTYCYFGEEDDQEEDKAWKEEDELDENLAGDSYRLPAFVKLTFEYKGTEKTVTIPIEKRSPNGLWAE
ncbi:MAG: hypothetical protein CMI30_01115 [Opitutae bacterium]|nr:hypothetical protein [Opitutae bacterium]